METEKTEANVCVLDVATGGMETIDAQYIEEDGKLYSALSPTVERRLIWLEGVAAGVGSRPAQPGVSGPPLGILEGETLAVYVVKVKELEEEREGMRARIGELTLQVGRLEQSNQELQSVVVESFRVAMDKLAG